MVFVISPEGREVTIRRTRGLGVPVITVISAGYSPSRVSMMVPSGSSTVHTIGLVATGVTSTFVRNGRKGSRTRVSIRRAFTTRTSRTASLRRVIRIIRNSGRWCFLFDLGR